MVSRFPFETYWNKYSAGLVYRKMDTVWGPYPSSHNSAFCCAANHTTSELVEVFTDSDWAGDQSNCSSRRRHSVSSAMIFLNGRAVTSRSRSQKSIALSSCESEYLAAVGGGAEGIHIGRLWTFLVRKETEVDVVTDSSSCRAFAPTPRSWTSQAYRDEVSMATAMCQIGHAHYDWRGDASECG